MATIQVKSAFVEDVLTGERGVWALKTSEPHSRKREDGSYETTSRTFRTVRASNDSGIDLGEFVKGDRITFTGTEKTDVREHQGKKYYDLLVWADTIGRAGDRPQGHAGSTETTSAPDEPWGVPSGPQNASWDTETQVPF